MSLQDLTAKVLAKADGQSPLGKVIKFALDDGAIRIDGTGENNTITNDDTDADCTVNVTSENFERLLTGDLNPMTAFMTGKIKIDGDMGVAMKLQNLF